GGKRPFVLRHPELDTQLLAKPPSHADMIGMAMGDDDARHPRSGERAVQEPAPRLTAIANAEPCIDECDAIAPLVAIVYNPQIDVIRIGHHQPQPAYAGRYRHQLFGLRRALAERI